MTTVTSGFSNHWRSTAALTFFTACLLVGTAGVAHAAEPAAAVTVAYGDLNLGSAAGADTLYARIVSAAREVCNASRVSVGDLHGLALERSCESQAIARAVHDVHSPALAALYSTRARQG